MPIPAEESIGPMDTNAFKKPLNELDHGLARPLIVPHNRVFCDKLGEELLTVPDFSQVERVH